MVLTGPVLLGFVLRQFDAALTDYLHKRKFPILGPLFTWLLRFSTAGALVGVYQFNTNDVGTCPRIRVPPVAIPRFFLIVVILQALPNS